MSPVLIPAREAMSHVGWLRVYARPIRSAPTYYKRQRMWVVLHQQPNLFVAHCQQELKRLVEEFHKNGGDWYEANIIDIEDAVGIELEAE